MKTKTKDKILAIVAILLLTSIVIVTIDFALGLAGLFPNCSLIKSLTHNYTNNNVLIPVNALAHMDPASAIAMCSNPEVQPI